MDETRLVAISDTHFGSSYGLLPPAYLTSEGIVVQQNSGQEYVWACWQNFCERVKAFAPDIILHVGDATEGTQKKEGGAHLSLRMMVDQRETAVIGLQMLRDAAPEAKWYFQQGTAYHVGENGDSEEEIARRLGAERYNSVGPGIYVREILWLYIDDVIIEAAHPIGGAGGFYRATALDREMQWSAISGKDTSKGMPKADLLIRAHRHYFMNLNHASKQGVQLPCWQLQTTHARKSSVHRYIPDLGGVFVTIRPENKKRGSPPCEIDQQLYDIPPVPLTRM